MVGETFVRGQPRHARIDARLFWITIWVGGADGAESASGGVEQDHVNIVVVLRLLFSPELPVTPSVNWNRVLGMNGSKERGIKANVGAILAGQHLRRNYGYSSEAESPVIRSKR